MTLNYQNVWSALNDLKMISSKICSARSILDSALDSLNRDENEKARNLVYAVDEFLKYYLQEFDEKFKITWSETVTKLKNQEFQNNSWESYYYPEEYSDAPPLTENYTDFVPSNMEALSNQKEDKVIRWRLLVDKIENGDTGDDEYFITFPDDLLEATNLKPGDEVEWIDNGDGSFLLQKVGQ